MTRKPNSYKQRLFDAYLCVARASAAFGARPNDATARVLLKESMNVSALTCRAILEDHDDTEALNHAAQIAKATLFEWDHTVPDEHLSSEQLDRRAELGQQWRRVIASWNDAPTVTNAWTLVAWCADALEEIPAWLPSRGLTGVALAMLQHFDALPARTPTN